MSVEINDLAVSLQIVILPCLAGTPKPGRSWLYPITRSPGAQPQPIS
jgi:hypothetical protein